MVEDDLIGVPVQGLTSDSFLLDRLNLIRGGPLGEEDHRTVLLGSALATAMGKQVGDTIELLENEPFRVVGVYESFNVFENGAVIMKLEDLQQLMLRENEVTAFSVMVERHDRETLERLQSEIEGLGRGVEAKPAREVAESSAELRMARSVAWLTSTIALIIGSIGMLNTMLMAVFERTREFAMLRAIGWRKHRIVSMVLLEALLLSLAGAIVGAVAAAALTLTLSSLPASGRLVSGEIPWAVFAQGFTVAILLGVLGGVYPAYSAARLPPVEGLRHD
jgi:putative ABC transport system permease protein